MTMRNLMKIDRIPNESKHSNSGKSAIVVRQEIKASDFPLVVSGSYKKSIDMCINNVKHRTAVTYRLLSDLRACTVRRNPHR